MSTIFTRCNKGEKAPFIRWLRSASSVDLVYSLEKSVTDKAVLFSRSYPGSGAGFCFRRVKNGRQSPPMEYRKRHNTFT